ncbi:MAG: tetratricopeptide repeat protein [Cyclobacteriaceae bacterium]
MTIYNFKVLIMFLIACVSTLGLFSQSRRDSLMNVLQNGEVPDRALLLAEIGNTYYSSNLEIYRDYQDSALAISETDQSLAFIQHRLGDYYDRKSRYDSAIYFYTESSKLNALIKNRIGEAKAISSIGLMYYKTSQYDLSSKYLFEAVKKAEATGDLKTIANCYGYLGHLSYGQKNFDDALRYQKLSMAIHTEDNDPGNAATAAVNIANAFHQKDELDSALAYLNLALEQFVANKDTLAQSYPYNNMAMILTSQKKYRESIEYLKKGLAIRIQYDEQRGVSFGYNYLGRNYQNLGEYNRAIENYNKAIEHGTPINYVRLLENTYAGLSECHEYLNQYKQAYEYQKQKDVLSDTIFNQQKIRELTQAQTKYETEKKEQEIRLLNAETELQAASIARNNLLLASAIALIVFLFVFAVIMYRQRDLRAKANLEREKSKSKSEQIKAVISSQEKERKRFAMDLHDDFGQLISALKLNVSRIKESSKPDTVSDKSEEILDSMYSSLKNIAFDLMPHTLFEKGLEDAIDGLKDQVNASGAIAFDFQSFEIKNKVDDDQKVAIYRIIQELVSNTIKYSNASKINISITDLGEDLSLLIEDDGDGFDLKSFMKGKGNGWKNINSRLDLLHGIIDFDTIEGRKNTTVSIEIPYKLEEVAVA